MTACVEYHADDDLIVFRCCQCGASEDQSKGKADFTGAISAFLKRSKWRAVMREGRKKLVCPDCQRTEEAEALVGKMARWIADQRCRDHEMRRIYGEAR